MLSLVNSDGSADDGSLIDEIMREGARRMLAAALSAQSRWRAVNAPQLVAVVRAGARFERGILIEREEVTAA